MVEFGPPRHSGVFERHVAWRHGSRFVNLQTGDRDALSSRTPVGPGAAAAMADEYGGAGANHRRAVQERAKARWLLRDMVPALVGAGRMEEARVEFKRLMQAYPDLTVKKLRQASVFSPEVLERKVERLKSLGLPN